jgi:hypothetical protein
MRTFLSLLFKLINQSIRLSGPEQIPLRADLTPMMYRTFNLTIKLPEIETPLAGDALAVS